MSEKPNIYRYKDFREYLKDTYNYKKAVGKFSLRTFASKAGFTSHNTFKHVMLGKRGLSDDGIPKFCKGLGLTKDEGEFFESLVHYTQSKNTSQKKSALNQLRKNRHYKEIKQLDSDQYEYFSHWYYAAVRELTTHPNFNESPDWIAKTLMPNITPKQAKEAMDLLFRLKLIKRNRNGKLVPSDAIIASAPRVYSKAIKDLHQQLYKVASQALYELPGDLRDMTTITMGIQEKDIPEIRNSIMRFRRRTLSTYEAKAKGFDRVYQMSVSLFPLSHPVKKR